MEETGKFYGAGAGMMVIIGMLLVSGLIVTTVLRFTSVPEDSVRWLLLIISMISFFTGGLIAGGRAKEKGMLTGAVTAAGVLLIFILLEYLGYDSAISGMQLLHFALFTACAVFGGVIGVNTSSS
ncbi:TIGR04086 family membrane protein [Salibacterium sp. K-3]